MNMYLNKPVAGFTSRRVRYELLDAKYLVTNVNKVADKPNLSFQTCKVRSYCVPISG